MSISSKLCTIITAGGTIIAAGGGTIITAGGGIIIVAGGGTGTDFAADGSWLAGTSSTVKDEPASMSTWLIYCAREPGVAAGGAWRNR